MKREPFTERQVDRAIDHMRDVVAEFVEPTRTYTELFAVARVELPRDLYLGGESHMITAFMKAFHDRCKVRGLPPYDALVVNMKGDRQGKPGHGYFVVNDKPDPFSEHTPPERWQEGLDFWLDQKEQAWAGER